MIGFTLLVLEYLFPFLCGQKCHGTSLKVLGAPWAPLPVTWVPVPWQLPGRTGPGAHCSRPEVGTDVRGHLGPSTTSKKMVFTV